MGADRSPISPPERLLCGPGPTNVDPAALEAMRRPMLGHLDPEPPRDPRSTWSATCARSTGPAGGLVLPIQATGTSGMEAGIANLVEPGDTPIIVGVNGYFGRRIAEMGRRAGAGVVEVRAHWGEHMPNERLMEAPPAPIPPPACSPSSTPRPRPAAQHPLAELGALMRNRDTLLMADCVTSLGGVELDFDAWGLDYAYSCTQKCLGAPPGMSPIAVSDRALDRVRPRCRSPVPFSLDLELLEGYWVERPATYHHPAPILHIYALHEVLRRVLEEGLERRWDRHTEAGRHLQARATDAGLRAAGGARPPARSADSDPGSRRSRRQGGPEAATPAGWDRGRRRARPRGARDLARGPDGPQREHRDGRPGPRRAAGARSRARASPSPRQADPPDGQHPLRIGLRRDLDIHDGPGAARPQAARGHPVRLVARQAKPLHVQGCDDPIPSLGGGGALGRVPGCGVDAGGERAAVQVDQVLLPHDGDVAGLEPQGRDALVGALERQADRLVEL